MALAAGGRRAPDALDHDVRRDVERARAEVVARGHGDQPAAGRAGRIHRGLDRRGVVGHAVAGGAEVADVERLGRGGADREQGEQNQASHGLRLPRADSP